MDLFLFYFFLFCFVSCGVKNIGFMNNIYPVGGCHFHFRLDVSDWSQFDTKGDRIGAESASVLPQWDGKLRLAVSQEITGSVWVSGNDAVAQKTFLNKGSSSTEAPLLGLHLSLYEPE